MDGLNEIGQSHGFLAHGDDGIVITPGETIITRVNLDIQGTELGVPDPACAGNEHVVTCTWPVLTDPHTVTIEHGLNVTATITYMRPGDTFYRHEILTD